MKNNNTLKENIICKNQPSEEEAKEAVKTLIAWAGDDPDREGLIETPKRVINAYKEFFEGYTTDPDKILSKTFEEVAGYDEAKWMTENIYTAIKIILDERDKNREEAVVI